MIIALVGKPSVGKSTFFKAATLADVEIHERPFTTIKTSEGVAYVNINCADKELNTQCNPREGFCVNHERFIPIRMIDVPGLVEKSYLGKGLGNLFLSDLNQADVLIHVIDASGSTNAKGETVEPGTYDPAEDIRFLETELDMWYLMILKRGWEKFARTIQQEQLNVVKSIAKQLSGLKVTEAIVQPLIKNMKPNPTEWTEDDLLGLARELRKETKPMVIAANKSDLGPSKENITRLQKDFPDYTIIPCAADAELALREAEKSHVIAYTPGDKTFKLIKDVNEKQQQALAFIQKNILDTYENTGIQTILNTAVFDILNYICIFPGGLNNLKDSSGKILPDCFLLPKGTTALQFAFRLHTDIGNNFIKAIDVNTKKPIGKDHVLKHRDIVEIMVKK